MCAKSLQLCLTLCDPLDCSPPQAPLSMGFPGKNTGVDCCALLLGIFPTQGLNPHLLCLLHLAGGFFATSVTCEFKRILSEFKMGHKAVEKTHHMNSTLELLTNVWWR